MLFWEEEQTERKSKLDDSDVWVISNISEISPEIEDDPFSIQLFEGNSIFQMAFWAARLRGKCYIFCLSPLQKTTLLCDIQNVSKEGKCSTFSFWLLRASGGCVLLNISGPTRLFERGYVKRENGVIVEWWKQRRGMEERDCSWGWTLAELCLGQILLIPFTIYNNHIMCDLREIMFIPKLGENFNVRGHWTFHHCLQKLISQVSIYVSIVSVFRTGTGAFWSLADNWC